MLDVFDIKLGTDTVPPYIIGDDDKLGLVAVQLLDAVQTIVDVLTDNDGGKGYDVSFTPTMDAYTDRSAKRRIVISVKPLLDAKPGTPLSTVAAIMAGFAIHEIGHTKLDFFTAVKARWPGKQLPQTMANIIEDVVLEARTERHYNGFADHGDGNIFHPTLVWVAGETCPKTPLKWSGSTGHKVNVTGQIVRYRPFVTFSDDKQTVAAIDFVEKWMTGITHDLTPSGCVALIEAWLDYVKDTMADDEVIEPPLPPDGGGCEFPTGNGGSIPDEDPDDTEGGDEDGDDDGEGNPGGDTEGEDSDDETEDGDGEGDTEGDDGEDGESEGDDDTEGEDGEPKGDGGSEDGSPREGDGNDADTVNRGRAPKGTNDGDGAGGSGQSISEAADPLDYDSDDIKDVGQSWDAISRPDNTFEQNRVASAEAEERVTTRLDAGIHGKMRVVFK